MEATSATDRGSVHLAQMQRESLLFILPGVSGARLIRAIEAGPLLASHGPFAPWTCDAVGPSGHTCRLSFLDQNEDVAADQPVFVTSADTVMNDSVLEVCNWRELLLQSPLPAACSPGFAALERRTACIVVPCRLRMIARYVADFPDHHAARTIIVGMTAVLRENLLEMGLYAPGPEPLACNDEGDLWSPSLQPPEIFFPFQVLVEGRSPVAGVAAARGIQSSGECEALLYLSEADAKIAPATTLRRTTSWLDKGERHFRTSPVAEVLST